MLKQQLLLDFIPSSFTNAFISARTGSSFSSLPFAALPLQHQPPAPAKSPSLLNRFRPRLSPHIHLKFRLRFLFSFRISTSFRIRLRSKAMLQLSDLKDLRSLAHLSLFFPMPVPVTLPLHLPHYSSNTFPAALHLAINLHGNQHQ